MKLYHTSFAARIAALAVFGFVAATGLFAQSYTPAKVYLVEKGPVIGPDVSFWDGKEGTLVDLRPWGGEKEEASGLFYLATDNKNLYVYAKITDNAPQSNTNPGGLAWRGTSIEFFFGTRTRRHSKYAEGDTHIRMYCTDKDNPESVAAALNDGQLNARRFKGYAVYGEKGYTIVASFPLTLLGLTKPLKEGQKVRCEFRINHAPMNSDRSLIANWRTDGDTAHSDAAVWSDGIVVK
jgi:hypothetical protein